MHLFRGKKPTRRPDREECKNYTSYRKTLREDFNFRCGYCDDTDLLRIRSFTIDHFVPRNPKSLIHEIPENYYYNLVYACSYCNGAKSNKWFTDDPKIHNDGSIGFVDPVDDSYTTLFKRNASGEIICNGVNTTLANYIINELKLWYPVHAVTWKLERLQKLEEKISERTKYKPEDVSSEDWNSILGIHNEILKELNDLYKKIFKENE